MADRIADQACFIGHRMQGGLRICSVFRTNEPYAAETICSLSLLFRGTPDRSSHKVPLSNEQRGTRINRINLLGNVDTRPCSPVLENIRALLCSERSRYAAAVQASFSPTAFAMYATTVDISSSARRAAVAENWLLRRYHVLITW